MGSVQRSLISYQGIDSCQYTNIKNFKQFNIDYIFCIPCQKPNIEQVIKVSVEPCVEHHEVVKTPVGISLEGQEVTGYKLLVSGDMKLKVEYVADEPTQSVHTAHTTFPFCSYIVLPATFNPSSMIFPTIAVEDVFSEQMDCRCVYNNITMLLVADIC
ncbi:DUF3794 domain-containing protein [Romboutsia sp.]|uniref:DUF3794 domain-containing protein n=1 Tax=Romboutsia sp. TaxID=1965302 RepID=UPI003F3BB674